MIKIYYLHELVEDDFILEELFINSNSSRDLFLISYFSFFIFLDKIIYKYSIKEDIVDILKNAIDAFDTQSDLISVSDFSFAVIDYLCHKYGESNLKYCRLIHLLYWNEANLVVYDASFLNLFIFDKKIVNNFDDIFNLVLENNQEIYYYNPNNIYDFSFMLFEKKFKPLVLDWKGIPGIINDS